MKQFFRIIGSPSPRIDTRKFGIIDFRTITPEDAFEAWKGGFEFIGITPEGAKEFLSNLNSTELAALIKSRTNLDDVLIIAKLKNTKAVKEAKKEMVEKLS
ncbi:MAG: hypothetical protein J5I47_13355 [Vicingus serpentipes]|nr:hypothetical protein [Vicingus serpentipes]